MIEKSKIIYLFPNPYGKSANKIQTVNFAYALDKKLAGDFLFITGKGYTDKVLNNLNISQKSSQHIELDLKYKKGRALQYIYQIFKQKLVRANDILYIRDNKIFKLLTLLKRFKLIENQIVFELHEINSDLLNNLSYADKIVTISNALREDLPEHLQNKPILVAHDGFNRRKAKTLANDDASTYMGYNTSNTIFYVGTYRDWKNIEFIVELANLLPKVNFVLIGMDKNELQVNAIPENLFIIKHLTHKEVYELLSKVKYAIHTLHPDFSISKYTSPLKLFEYLSAGLTVFAPKYPSIEEIITHNENGYLYNIYDAEDAAKLIQDTIENKLTLNKKKVKESVKNYSWDKRAERVITFLTLKGRE